MKARGFLLAFWAASAATQAQGQSPDWFDAFKGKAFVQGEASLVAREKSAPPDSAPLFRARWIVLRYAGFTEKERRFWPSRNLLLVTMPSGARYALESSLGYVDETHLEEERPWQRVASARTAFEVWMSGGDARPGEPPGDAPCDGSRERVRAPGGSLAFFPEDLGSRTVKAALAEIAAATFDEDERRDLAVLLRVSVASNRTIGTEMPAYHLRDPLLSVAIPFLGEVPPPDRRTVEYAPDLAAPADLSSWRAFAHLPLDLPPFPPLPAEGGLK